jgi:hypothetical protein
MPALTTATCARARHVFAGAVGIFVALSLLKFGNPVIVEHKLEPPSTGLEIAIWSWPVAWAYPLLAVLVLWGLALVYFGRPHQTGHSPLGKCRAALLWLPLAWFLWQCLSAAQTVDWPLTQATLKHFATCATCFYLGFFVVSRLPDLTALWLPILAGLIVVIGMGFDQHFGGLEQTRQFIYSQPGWQNQSPEFLNKIASNRIYSTLFYPNTLAEVILLFLPLGIAVPLTLRIRRITGRLLAVLIGFGGLACLYWSGSKAGWLIALLLGLIAWLYTGTPRKVKYTVMTLCLLAGLAGFLVRHSAYFEKGATSMGARFDYWRVATKIAVRNPVFGSGPGTFFVLYRYLKPPESEMTRMVHNDYLQQACDSGFMGFLLFSAFVAGSLLLPRPSPQCAPDGKKTALAFWPGYCLGTDHERIRFALWLGLVGWALQEFVEFGLYIPVTSWPAFLFMGWLWGVLPATNSIDRLSAVG